MEYPQRAPQVVYDQRWIDNQTPPNGFGDGFGLDSNCTPSTSNMVSAEASPVFNTFPQQNVVSPADSGIGMNSSPLSAAEQSPFYAAGLQQTFPALSPQFLPNGWAREAGVQLSPMFPPQQSGQLGHAAPPNISIPPFFPSEQTGQPGVTLKPQSMPYFSNAFSIQPMYPYGVCPNFISPNVNMYASPMMMMPNYNDAQEESPSYCGKVMAKKRRLTRRQPLPTTVEMLNKRHFSKEVARELNKYFYCNIAHPYPSEKDKERIAHRFGASVHQITDWFGNKRARYGRHLQRMQLEYDEFVGGDFKEYMFENQIALPMIGKMPECSWASNRKCT